jgi:hypothetical protein
VEDRPYYLVAGCALVGSGVAGIVSETAEAAGFRRTVGAPVLRFQAADWAVVC